MDKNIIKQRLTKTFLSEESVPGLTVTNAANKKSAKFNKDGLKDIEKKVSDFEKSVKTDPNSKEMGPNKFNYTDDFQKKYHDEMEIMNGQEMIKYDSIPSKTFSERAVEAIEGSAKMGNNPEWANVVPAQQGFTGPTFGKELVKKIKNSAKLRGEETPAVELRGKDIQELPTEMKGDNGSKPIAINKGVSPSKKIKESSENKDNNKTQIKESMKRLKFKTPFNGVGNALRLIPEGYKVDNKVFEMSDGNENYKIRWEGTLSEGKAVVLTASDKELVNEDITRMKQLFGYKSEDTLGLVKGNARLDENKMFTDILNKTKSLMTESEDMEGLKKPSEGEWEEETKSSPEAKKHIEGSVSTDKGTQAPKAKEGELDKAVKQAPEAKKHIEGSVSTDKGTQAPKPKEGNWEEAGVTQASEAKKHVHLKETKEGQEEGWMKNEEEEEEGKVVDETFDIEKAEFMKEGEMDGEEETEEPTDDSSWAKPDEDDVETGEPDIKDIKGGLPKDISLDDDSEEDDEEEIVSTPSPVNSMDDSGFKLLSNGQGVFKIMVKGQSIDVPNDEIYTLIANDKSIKAADRAERIYDEMKKYGDLN